jgi:hypothetical protein
MKIALQAGFGTLLAALGFVAGWGVWEAQTTALQGLVIGCIAMYVAAGWVASREEDPLQGALPNGGVYRTLAMFIAGAGMGALAYHGEVALLYAAIWASALVWVEHKLRSRFGELIGDLFGWL